MIEFVIVHTVLFLPFFMGIAVGYVFKDWIELKIKSKK